MLLRRLILVLLAAPAALRVPLHAQMHKVEAPERVTRAIAVYEWTGDMTKPTASRVVPVSLFIDSHFEDAGVYLARPVPFALESGDVYEVQASGQPLGTLDLDVARNIVARRSQAGDDAVAAWYGYGRFQPPAPEKPAAKLHISAHPSHIIGAGDDNDDTPHFVVRHPGDTPPAKTPAGSTPEAKPDTTDTSTTTSTTDTDSERPTLRHRDPKDDAKRPKKEKPQGYVTGPADSLNDDPDRPTLHRGSPDEDAEIPPLAGLPADMHQAVAVSDPASREPHDFTREWESSAEREQVLAGFERLARVRIAAYIATNKLEPVAADLVLANAPLPPAATHAATAPSSARAASLPTKAPGTTVERQESAAPVTDATTDANGDPIAPGSGDAPSLRDRTAPATVSHEAAAPAPPATATAPPALPSRPAVHRRRPSGPTVLALTSEELHGYELSYGALPTFVYTAESPVAVGGPVYVTLVAQRLPSGELQTALTSVTDATHLDRVPWMRPVDAVDPDWSHRASLLFELRAQSSRQFALYRLVTEQAEQTFVTGVIE
jgi:hypothetical protein